MPTKARKKNTDTLKTPGYEKAWDVLIFAMSCVRGWGTMVTKYKRERGKGRKHAPGRRNRAGPGVLGKLQEPSGCGTESAEVTQQ